MKNINVLIIEQNSEDAKELESNVKSIGFNVIGIAFNSVSALEIINKTHIDVIICDIAIAGECDGACLAEQIEKNYSTCVVFIAKHYSDEILRRLSKTRYSSIICKPYKRQDIEIALKMAGLKHNSKLLKPMIKLGSHLHYDKFSKILQKGRDIVALTKKEQELLHILVMSKGICSFEVVNQIWIDKPVGESTRRMLLYKLKKKIPEIKIITHKGIGLELIKPDEVLK